MDNDELRDAARLLAVMQTLRAVIEHIAEQDEAARASIFERTKSLIETKSYATPEIGMAAREICRRELFKPLD